MCGDEDGRVHGGIWLEWPSDIHGDPLCCEFICAGCPSVGLFSHLCSEF